MDKHSVLTGWKEIAGYVRLGIRTVQRYEKSLGFPVRRPDAKDRGSVFAFSHEIDSWFSNAMVGKPDTLAAGNVVPIPSGEKVKGEERSCN